MSEYEKLPDVSIRKMFENELDRFGYDYTHGGKLRDALHSLRISAAEIHQDNRLYSCLKSAAVNLLNNTYCKLDSGMFFDLTFDTILNSEGGF